MDWSEPLHEEWLYESEFDSTWPSPTTPEQKHLDDMIRYDDLRTARSFVENMSPEIRQKLTEDSTLMCTALRNDYTTFIRFLVEECNAEVEKPIKKSVSDDSVCVDSSYTPLRYSARFRKTNAVIELLRLGANVNAVSPNLRLTALHDACKSGTLDIVRDLIQHGADLTMKDKRGKTALMYGVDHVDVCLELIERGADVNATDNAGNTALHETVSASRQNMNIEAAALLIENGADFFLKNNNGEDAFCIACMNLATDILKVMRDQLPDDAAGHEAVIRSHQLLGASYLDHNQEFRGFSLVPRALVEWEAAVGLREDMRHVFSGEDNIVSTPNPVYDNAVEVDSMVKFNQMRQDKNKIYMQGLLLKEKILGPTHRKTIESVINLAGFYNRSEDYGRALRLLTHGFKLSRGRMVNSIMNSLCLDVRVSVGNIVAYHKDAFNNTADFKDVYEFLEAVTEEAKRSVEPTTEDSSLTLSFMDGAVSESFMQITLFLIKLFFLREEKESDIVQLRMLVHDFVRLNLRSSEGITILMMAICTMDQLDCDSLSYDVEAIKLLLECGADSEEIDNNGNSVLHLLALANSQQSWILEEMRDDPNKETNNKVAGMLLAFGAHFDARNYEGFTAVDYLSLLGLEFSAHMTLQCLAAQVIRRHKIPYAGILPKSLVDFVQMH